jgi:hypothetical protein
LAKTSIKTKFTPYDPYDPYGFPRARARDTEGFCTLARRVIALLRRIIGLFSDLMNGVWCKTLLRIASREVRAKGDPSEPGEWGAESVSGNRLVEGFAGEALCLLATSSVTMASRRAAIGGVSEYPYQCYRHSKLRLGAHKYSLV